MLIFKSLSDLEQIPNNDPAYLLVQELLVRLTHAGQSRPYRPEVHGYVVLIQPADVDQMMHLPELQSRLEDVPCESEWCRAGRTG